MADQKKKRIKLKCISNRLNYVGFNGEGQPHRVRVGDTFFVKTIDGKVPAKWAGLVTEVEGGAAKTAVTNPAKGGGQKAQASASS